MYRELKLGARRLDGVRYSLCRFDRDGDAHEVTDADAAADVSLGEFFRAGVHQGCAVCDEIPSGWVRYDALGLAPSGYQWICNGISVVKRGHCRALIRVDKSIMPEYVDGYGGRNAAGYGVGAWDHEIAAATAKMEAGSEHRAY